MKDYLEVPVHFETEPSRYMNIINLVNSLSNVANSHWQKCVLDKQEPNDLEILKAIEAELYKLHLKFKKSL